MKLIITALVVLFLVLQYKLWFDQGGVVEAWQLKKQIASQAKQNDQLQERNQALVAEVDNLKQGKQAIAERARAELGMVKKGEVFYQVVGPANAPASQNKSQANS